MTATCHLSGRGRLTPIRQPDTIARADAYLSPDDNVAQLGPTTTLKTAHWASGFLGTGWGVTYDGNGDFRTLYADELHVAAFIADTARVAVGAEYITPSMALIARPFTIPAVNGNGDALRRRRARHG
jgi:hypothetical protein